MAGKGDTAAGYASVGMAHHAARSFVRITATSRLTQSTRRGARRAAVHLFSLRVGYCGRWLQVLVQEKTHLANQNLRRYCRRRVRMRGKVAKKRHRNDTTRQYASTDANRNDAPHKQRNVRNGIYITFIV